MAYTLEPPVKIVDADEMRQLLVLLSCAACAAP